jgi:two-component system OmpR family response regulator
MQKPLRATRPRILVAEDDEGLLDLITLRLELAGYDIFQARDGANALRQIRQVNPAGVVLDVNMPVMDGFAVLREVARTPALRSVPIMVMTARNRPEDVQTAIGLGARDYLAKPIDERVFLVRVARLIRKAPGRPPPDDSAVLL